MKKISKMALLAVAGMISLPQAFAQEAEEETFATEESEYTADFGDDFGGGFDDFGSDDSAPTYYINAETGVDMRGYIGTYDGSAFNSGYETKSQAEVFDSLTDASAYANMTLGYSAQNSEMEFKLKFDGNSLGDYNQDILDEATARLFLGNWVIEGGKMKVVWGKGDKLHVLDNFNANDYTDFIFGDYIDRRIAEPMLRVKYNVPNTNWSIEGVYTPMMTADRFASSGVWAPAAQKKLTSVVETLVKTNLEAKKFAADKATATLMAAVATNSATPAQFKAKTDADAKYLNYLSGATSIADELYPDTEQLRYGQAGVRVLGTVGSVDLGASYYYGHYKQPSANLSSIVDTVAGLKTNTAFLGAYGAALQAGQMTTLQAAQAFAIQNGLELDLPTLAYDQKQTFGLEAAFVVWKFNTRWELGYNLTKDTAGDDPWVKNNSVEWLAGFDVNLPIHNMNLNVQETGKYILNNDKIEDNQDIFKLAGVADLGVSDVDANSDGKYINNRVVMNLSDNFLYENLKPEVTVIWGIENNEWCVQPKVNYKVADGMNLGVSGGVLYCYNENGEFYNFTADSTKWHTKSFVQASVRYEF